MSIGIYALVFLISFIINYGLTVSYFSGKFNNSIIFSPLADRLMQASLAFSFAVAGPVGVLIVFFLSDMGKYGWRIK